MQGLETEFFGQLFDLFDRLIELLVQEKCVRNWFKCRKVQQYYEYEHMRG